MRIQHVLAATDLGPAGDTAVRAAHQVATHMGARLHVVHVVPDAPPSAPLFPQNATPNAGAQRSMLEAARGAVQQRVAELTGLGQGAVDLHVLEGPAVQGILDARHRTHADLVVVGGRHPGGLWDVLVGTHAETVVRRCPVPVLVARGEMKPGHRVVAATDLAAPSLPALRMGVEMARAWKLPLTVLHSVEQYPVVPPAMGALTGEVTVPPPAMVAELRGAATATVRTHLEEHGMTDAAVEVVDGPATATVLDRARQPDVALLVMATHGRTGLARVALGSVAEAVVARAPCNVLVVRWKEAVAQTA